MKFASRGNETQRQQLLDAIVEVSCELGYEGVTITRLTNRAGVSRRTFYEHFPNKGACFLVALQALEGEMRARVACRIELVSARGAAAEAIAAIASYAVERPLAARFLMNEAMAAGPLGQDARDRTVDEIALLVEGAYRQVDAAILVPGLPSGILIGASYRVLALSLIGGERASAPTGEELLSWVRAYESPLERGRWRTNSPSGVHAPPAPPGRIPLRAPARLAPGRPRRSAPEVSENHRVRIILATAETVRRDGYAAATVAEIARAAGVDGRVFYKLFADKRDAFGAVLEFAFQNTMAVTAGAFFAGGDWPHRVWNAAATFTHYLEQNPALAYACIVESRAGEDTIARRLQDLVSGFTIFLQEGYEYRQEASGAPSRLALEAIAQASLEILYREIRRAASPDTTGLIGHLTYVSLAPFLGAQTAEELIAEMAGEANS
jgi:AcrR family transcriptional regulator